MEELIHNFLGCFEIHLLGVCTGVTLDLMRRFVQFQNNHNKANIPAKDILFRCWGRLTIVTICKFVSAFVLIETLTSNLSFIKTVCDNSHGFFSLLIAYGQRGLFTSSAFLAELSPLSSKGFSRFLGAFVAFLYKVNREVNQIFQYGYNRAFSAYQLRFSTLYDGVDRTINLLFWKYSPDMAISMNKPDLVRVIQSMKKLELLMVCFGDIKYLENLLLYHKDFPITHTTWNGRERRTKFDMTPEKRRFYDNYLIETH